MRFFPHASQRRYSTLLRQQGPADSKPVPRANGMPCSRSCAGNHRHKFIKVRQEGNGGLIINEVRRRISFSSPASLSFRWPFFDFLLIFSRVTGMSTKSRTKSSAKKSLANEVLAVVLIAAAVLLLLSLFSYDSRDPSPNSVGPQREPHNLIGVVGAFISDVFLQWFGLASLLVPALLIIVALRAFSTKDPGFPA